MEFQVIYAKVRAIVLKTRKEYYIHLWDQADWEQEGRIVLFHLIQKQPQIVASDKLLCTYFKVKFRNHVKDEIRKQESVKRRFNRLPHEDISEVAHLIGRKGLVSDDFLILKSQLRDYYSQLPVSLKEKYDCLLSGKAFHGRATMVRELQEHLKDFKDDPLP